MRRNLRLHTVRESQTILIATRSLHATNSSAARSSHQTHRTGLRRGLGEQPDRGCCRAIDRSASAFDVRTSSCAAGALQLTVTAPRLPARSSSTRANSRTKAAGQPTAVSRGPKREPIGEMACCSDTGHRLTDSTGIAQAGYRVL